VWISTACLLLPRGALLPASQVKTLTGLTEPVTVVAFLGCKLLSWATAFAAVLARRGSFLWGRLAASFSCHRRCKQRPEFVGKETGDGDIDVDGTKRDPIAAGLNLDDCDVGWSRICELANLLARQSYDDASTQRQLKNVAPAIVPSSDHVERPFLEGLSPPPVRPVGQRGRRYLSRGLSHYEKQ
jgi:hypothetical protein